MGAGIAKGFRARYPEMAEQFRVKCKAVPREFNLGDAWLWKDDKQPWVFNLGTQEGIWRARASYEAIETALKGMKTTADGERIGSIAIPRIGVGYGGLSWKKVKLIIEAVFGDWPSRLVVYEDFVPAESAAEESAEPKSKASSKPAATSKAAKTTKSRDPKVRMCAVTIACTDVQRSAEFYETVLGAKPLPTDLGCRWYELGKTRITLLPNAAEPSAATFPSHAMFMLWVEVDDLAKAAQRFASHQVTILDEGDGQFMMIADPDGLVIEVWEKGVSDETRVTAESNE